MNDYHSAAPAIVSPPVRVRTHPLAIASLVCGILSIIGGYVLLFPPALAIIFGHVARHTCKKNPLLVCNGLAITGLILGYLTTLLNIALVAFIAFAVIKGADQSSYTPKDAQIDPPVYNTLLGDNFCGSGFHFQNGDTSFIACSLHQFDGSTPKLMHHLDLDDPIKIIAQVAKFDDIQILRYEHQELEKITPLPYNADEELAKGDPVYLFNADKVYLGHLKRVNSTLESKIEMESPYPAAGNSGSPVISALTGNVIGVMLSANDAEAATEVGFERLTWKR